MRRARSLAVLGTCVALMGCTSEPGATANSITPSGSASTDLAAVVGCTGGALAPAIADVAVSAGTRGAAVEAAASLMGSGPFEAEEWHAPPTLTPPASGETYVRVSTAGKVVGVLAVVSDTVGGYRAYVFAQCATT
jgi:hypothetical protein